MARKITSRATLETSNVPVVTGVTINKTGTTRIYGQEINYRNRTSLGRYAVFTVVTVEPNGVVDLY